MTSFTVTAETLCETKNLARPLFSWLLLTCFAAGGYARNQYGAAHVPLRRLLPIEPGTGLFRILVVTLETQCFVSIGSSLIFAARMKSFSLSPPMA